ncbi:UDP-N-acetylglucosamine 1-carboxyvinyltransferase [Pajaroellobacter abortibovis]|uniref:UDP-N-acetylglucosamine 1-carboxyvinyltransferase n=1 Tax=Pajaroellobacter abortibovis TaxID=1882918 RepID=A0A1L6MY89_9BACT|nr:UDP-N-acetylglucosamine 1-carboxyvinyltransferase [Pajaroellobacter abortibovis]APS00490.1 UDP-N-acetylglucosamine 1-carboxyvinyltransferase [Pajaroellobacter abortibovis]
MDAIRIRGGNPLRGKIQISGAKNAALPILYASLLSDGASRLRNVPRLRDIHTTAALLTFLGRKVDVAGSEVYITEGSRVRPEAPYELVKQMRASFLALGPLVARFGRAKVSLPGGCAIGARPVDQHLKGLEAMGCTITLERGNVLVVGPHGGGRLYGTEFCFDLPTVTGTENLMMAAALAKGQTTLINCAREPEVEELGKVLNKMGAQVDGAGTDVIRIRGSDPAELLPFDHATMPDRIEAGTYMIAASVIHGSEVTLEGVEISMLDPIVSKLRAAGVEVEREASALAVRRSHPLHPVHIITAPYPGFPTDMQAQFLVLMCFAKGESVITETIFENRFTYVPELRRMGASISLHAQTAMVQGVDKLYGASVMATDLRASASLIIAGLCAEQETEVRRVYHLDRGYERIEEKLRGVGATIERVKGVDA